MDYKDLSPEQIERMKGLSAEELHKLAAEEGMPISDEDLDQIAGGWSDSDQCPSGGEHDWNQTGSDFTPSTTVIPIYTCQKCGATYQGRIS